jgi:uncharacterized iron-regulated membrane protein
MLALLPFLLILGFFLPGFFIAKYLRHPLWGASAFVISLVILFHCVFWLGVFGIPIKLWTVLPLLIAASGAAAWLQRRFAPPVQKPAKSAKPSKTPKKTAWTRLDRILLAASLTFALRRPFGRSRRRILFAFNGGTPKQAR